MITGKLAQLVLAPIFRPLSTSLSTIPSARMFSSLKGVKVIEFGGLAPVPFCGLILADFGADVTVVEKPSGNVMEQGLTRGKKFITADLKSKDDVAKIRDLCSKADVVLDPYRPGILEKLGLDPVQLLADNENLIVCRLTGYGQVGPMSQEAGHDINYVAISGLLPIIAGHNRHPPWPPANLLGDFAGGSLTAAFGIVAALFERANGGKGCIIDASMTEGLAYLGTFISKYKSIDNLFNVPYASFSGDCPIYRCYETKDGKFVSVGALEPKFNDNLFQVLQVKSTVGDVYQNPADVVKELESVFKTKTRDEWAEFLKGKDTCAAPVLDFAEVGQYQHNDSRGTFTKEGDVWMPNPAPKKYSAEEFKALREEFEKKCKL